MSPTSAPRIGAHAKVLALLIAIAAVTTLALPGTAGAADSAYWSNYLGGKLSHANLDGSGGGADLGIPNVFPENPTGVAIDASAGRLYWADRGANAIYWANLNGSGAGKLFTGSATVSEPYGMAVDSASGKLYWANSEEDSISYANLDDNGGGNLYTTGLTGATLNDPRGLAIDPAANRIYWANFEGGTISYANLDGTGAAADLNTTGVTIGHPGGLAIDRSANRIYWSNETPQQGIFYANLDGGGAGGLSTAGAALSGPGVSRSTPTEDASSGRTAARRTRSPTRTWTARATAVSSTPPAQAWKVPTTSPCWARRSPLPRSASPKSPARRSSIGRCIAARAPGWRTFPVRSSTGLRSPTSTAWLRNGEAIAGATESNYRPTEPGIYDCQVTATNFAGSATLTSADLTLERGYAYAGGFAPVHGRRALITLTCTGNDRCKGLVKLIGHVGYKRVVHREGRRKVIRRRALLPLGRARFSIYPGRTKVLHLKLKRKAAHLLRNRPRRRWHVKLLGRDVAHRGLLLKAPGNGGGARHLRAWHRRLG